jgi:hypothetical protein
MIADTIRERLNKEPFQPFRIRSSSGRAYLVSNPDLVVMMKSEMFIAAANSDRWAHIPFLHFAAVEAVRNGNDRGPRGARRKKRR